MNVSHGKDGYDGQTQDAWAFVFRQEIQNATDDGAVLTANEWIDLGYLSQLYCHTPRASGADALFDWRGFARIRVQKAVLTRLYIKELVWVLDVNRNYIRLSAKGYYRLARVWEYIRSASQGL